MMKNEAERNKTSTRSQWSRRDLIRFSAAVPMSMLLDPGSIFGQESLAARASTRSARDAMRTFPDTGKFLIGNEKDGAPDKNGWYYHALNVTETSDGLVCVYRRTDSHTAVISDIFACHSSDRGRTWKDHKQLSHSSVWATGGLWVAPQLTRLRDGRLVIISDFGKRNTGQNWPLLSQWQKPDRGMSNHLFWSSDNGKTWSGPTKIDDVGGEPGYIVELENGTLMYTRTESFETEAVWNPPMPWGKNYYRNVAVFSDDGGKTWSRTATITDDPHQSDCETGVVELGRNNLLAVTRIGFGGGQFGQPSRLIYSADNGKTWEDKRLSPIYGHRPIIRKLQSGKLLVTFRNHWGTPATYAAVFSPEEKLEYEPAAYIWNEKSCRIRDRAMRLETREGRENGVIFALYPAQAPDSRVEFEAEMRVATAAKNGCSISAGCFVRFEPGRVSLADRPADGFSIDTERFHKYRIVREKGKIAIFVDGEVKLERSTDGIETRLVQFGNRLVQGWFGALHNFDNETKRLENDALSEWRRISVRVTNRHDHSIDWNWSAEEGYPDPFRRNNAVCLDRNASFSPGNSGYSGWTQMKDGTIVIADYTSGDPAAPIPFARAYVTTEKELFG